MITVTTASQPFNPGNLQPMEMEVYDSLERSPDIFSFFNIGELLFEIKLRKNIMNAAHDLKKSGAVFTSFEHSNFNPVYWVRSARGYILRPDVVPSHAINDVFQNGRLYGFECSTAMVLIFYKAVLDSIRTSEFNHLFGGLLVWNWNYDPDLAIITKKGRNFVLGDVVYFYNPDHDKPIWLGENAVVMGGGLYFGHGIGLMTAQEMINALNTLRRPGAVRSAFLLDQHSRLDSKYLYRFSNEMGIYRKEG